MSGKQLGRLSPMGHKVSVEAIGANLMVVEYTKREDEQPSEGVYMVREQARELRDWLNEWLDSQCFCGASKSVDEPECDDCAFHRAMRMADSEVSE